MMFLFGYLGWKLSPSGWPVELMHATEKVLLALALTSFALAWFVRPMRTGNTRKAVQTILAIVGGVSAGIALLMPIELAPFFFGVRGEWMMATMVLILFYPAAAVPFVMLLMKIMTPASAGPPKRPAA